MRDETLVLRDETLISRDETLISRDETLVLRDETLISREASFISRDETLVLQESGNLHLGGAVLYVQSHCLIAQNLGKCLLLTVTISNKYLIF